VATLPQPHPYPGLRTSRDLVGAELDYWVAQHDPRCVGLAWEWRADHWVGLADNEVACFITDRGFAASMRLSRQYKNGNCEYHVSRDGGECSLLIERARIALNPTDVGWVASMAGISAPGETHMQAVARCYLTHCAGHTVEAHPVAQ
jgi:hypothetical protein